MCELGFTGLYNKNSFNFNLCIRAEFIDLRKPFVTAKNTCKCMNKL